MAYSALVLVLLLVIIVVLAACSSCCNAHDGGGGEVQKNNCSPSSCGDILNISYPFRLKGDPSSNCGDPSYELVCEDNRTVLYLFSGKYYVKRISYQNLTIQVVDTALRDHDCSSLPRHSLTALNFSREDPYTLSDDYHYFPLLTFINCGIPVNSFAYIDTIPCINFNRSDSSKSHSYVLRFGMVGEVKESCTVELSVSYGWHVNISEYRSFSEIHRQVLMKGVELSWSNLLCRPCFARGRSCYVLHHNRTVCYYHCAKASQSFYCFMEQNGLVILAWVIKLAKIIGYIMSARPACGIIGLSAFLIYKFHKRHLSLDESIEQFLQSHNNLVPIRYSYSEIRNITKGFKNKLGQGGYGCVFKGKLRSGHLVAVKILSKPKANGQEFINEVATIGRIHHVNVVRLAGFCVDGSKRALIYDFMPNGSLEKYIFPGDQEGGIPLCWEKMYEIALGVARVIEYLHQGCDMQILHFDIKPHNILLDEKFTPKVSDFGLAKLYPVDDSIVSLTAARGTIGYIAPELFYKNIGGVSYKADVYSFGMLLMEMVGRRKNVNPFAENSSQIYFPAWIYDRFNQGEEMEIGDAEEDEKKIVRKLVLVAFWCIQMKPADRPSMGKVIEMLEGPVELLQVPPKPFLFSPENMTMNDHAESSTNPAGPSVAYESSELLSSNSLESIPLTSSVYES